MRVIHTDLINKTIKEMCIESNIKLSPDMKKQIKMFEKKETSEIGKQILTQIVENMEIAEKESIPICQDTGMAIVFIKLGQDVHIEGTLLEDAINEGIRQGYKDGYLRMSVVGDPIIRNNTGDNTPAIIHLSMVLGDQINITIVPKGFGSENMSFISMLKPSDGIEGIKKTVLEVVKKAGPNACPPVVVGVGIGGSFEKCALIAKEALTRSLEDESPFQHIRDLEKELLYLINNLGIGPGGLGGKTTALGVKIETYPTHIAGLPVAVNLCCHVNRHVTKTL